MNKPKFEPSKLIEKYRWPIGAGLLLLILVLGGYLLWRENYQKPAQESRITNYESRIMEMEKRISELEKLKSTLPESQPISSADESSSQTAGTVAGASTPAVSQQVGGVVNINTATVAELDTLSGIGPVYAGRIIDYRNANGGFKTPEEIMNIKGIGEKTFEKFKDKITI